MKLFSKIVGLLQIHIVFKDGTYRLIEMNHQGSWKIKEPIDIFYDKKSKQINGSQNTNYAYIQELDYYSKILDMNKSIDYPKKVIHSRHYLALFVKKIVFFQEN